MMSSPILKTYFEQTACVAEEFTREPLRLLHGTLPESLQGTLFRNGNGRFVQHGVPYRHLFDGDGMITKFHFEDGAVLYSNRYVRTMEFEKEEAAGQMLFRSFGTNIPGGFAKNFLKTHFKNAANTHVIWHGGKLLALWEGGLPHELDPATLQTKGRYHYHGALLNPFSPLDRVIAPELAFSAHPKTHADGTLYNFGTTPGLKNRLILFEVSPDGKAKIHRVHTMKDLAFTHDFVLTDTRKKVFFITPVSFQLFKTFMGFQSPVEAIRSKKGDKTKVLVFDGDQTHELETDFTFIFHYINGFEQDGKLIIDGLAMDEFPDANSTQAVLRGDAEAVPQAYLRRYTIDLHQGKVRYEPLAPHPMELPEINPAYQGKPYQYAWTISRHPDSGSAILDALAKVDVADRQVALMEFGGKLPSEPIFAPKPHAKAQDEGWLMLLLYDSQQKAMTLNIINAQTLQTEAVLAMPHQIPLGFHGFWTEALF